MSQRAPRVMGIFWLHAVTLFLALAPAPAVAQFPLRDAAPESSSASGAAANVGEEEAEVREREGTRLVQQLGRFHSTGDRLTFQPAGSERQYLGLENLTLERVGKVLADRHEQAAELQWEITAVFTEYRGANYLLVTHAVLKTKPSRGTGVLSTTASR